MHPSIWSCLVGSLEYLIESMNSVTLTLVITSYFVSRYNLLLFRNVYLINDNDLAISTIFAHIIIVSLEFLFFHGLSLLFIILWMLLNARSLKCHSVVIHMHVMKSVHYKTMTLTMSLIYMVKRLTHRAKMSYINFSNKAK